EAARGAAAWRRGWEAADVNGPPAAPAHRTIHDEGAARVMNSPMCALLAAAVTVASADPVPSPTAAAASPAARSADDRLRRIQERREALEREVARLRGQEKTLLGDVERLGLEVRLRTEGLKAVRLVLERANREMDATVTRSRDLERSLAAARPVLAARARALFKLGDLSYVRLLLSVDHPSDFFRGYRFVSTLAHRDRERLSAFRSDL